MTDFEKQQFERQKQLAIDSFYQTYNPEKLRQNSAGHHRKIAPEKGISPTLISSILGENPPGDTALVAAVLMLLINAGSDTKITLALLYIIM